MTNAEFTEWQRTLAVDYAAEQVALGRWAQDGAVERALDDNAALLPQGITTPRMLLLRGVDSAGQPVGQAWVALDHPRAAPDTAYLYDIEVVPERRGDGFGRALLDAVEGAVADAGVYQLELNVYGRNLPAIGLYTTAGYSVTTQQMRKSLTR